MTKVEVNVLEKKINILIAQWLHAGVNFQSM